MSDLLDRFLFWDLLVVVLLCFTDWMIGEKQRAKIREHVGYFWIYLEDVSYFKLAVEDARAVVSILTATVGGKPLAPKRLFASCLPTLILGGCVAYSFIKSPQPGLTAADFAGSALVIIFLNCALDWASLAVTLSTFRSAVGKPSLAQIMSHIMLMLVMQVALSVGAVFLLWWTAGLLVLVSTEHIAFSVHLLVIACSKMAPAGLFLIYGALLFSCKSLRALLRWPISTVALRLHESKQGVLSQLAAAGGLLAKIGHEALKAF